MNIFGYLAEHWGMLILLIGMIIVLLTDIHLERRMRARIYLTNIMLFLYSVACYAETYLGNQTEYTVMRPILSALNYSLVTFILVNIIMIMYPGQKLFLLFPAVLNAVLCFVSVPTGIVFSISKDNHFGRGILGYLPYFINALYLLYLIYNMFKANKIQKEELLLPLFMSVTAVICLIAPLFIYDSTSHWFVITIAIDIFLYYVFLLQQFTKRDPLTKLLNRQSYYSDAEKYAGSVTAVVTMDMNGLKELNDNEGHIAGDKALKTLADCFWKASQGKQRVYRIGGDEYVILCLSSTEAEVHALTERIRQETAKTAYTCSIGYAMKSEDSTIDQLYKLADEKLYEEKKHFYEISGKDRRKRK